MIKQLKEDIQAVFARDPAARNTLEVLTTYPGIHALIMHRMAHELWKKERNLMECFVAKIKQIPNVKIYGDFSDKNRCPIVSLNIAGVDSSQVSEWLLEEYEIAVRSGAHCAPLMHKALGTVEQGVVRFSFSHFNTEAEVLQTAAAVQELAQEI